MVTPAIRRQVVGILVESALKLSERRACKAIGVHRSSIRYESVAREPIELLAAMRDIAAKRPRAGYRGIQRQLRKRGIHVNHRRVYRLYKREGLKLRTKRRRRFAASPRMNLARVVRRNQRWGMDFVSDHLVDGRRFRSLTVLDHFSRRSPGILVDTSITGERVARFLDELAFTRGLPDEITVDNGPEFISNALDQWATLNKVTLIFSRPGKPVDNAFVESFNGRFRDECLNANWFQTLAEAKTLINTWWADYNEHRPHSALGDMTPIEFEAAQTRTQRVA
jgi:putative transposase